MAKVSTTSSSPSSRNLNSVEIADVNVAFTKLLRNKLNSTILPQSSSASTISELVDAFAIGPAKDKPEVARDLLLLKSVYDISDGSIPLLSFLANESPLGDLRNVASTYLSKVEDSKTVDAEHLEAFRTGLFALEPTAVLYNLIAAGRIPVSENIKTDILAVLKEILPTFNIGKESVLTILKDQKIMEGVPLDHRKEFTEYFKNLQRLQALTSSPLDIAGLMKASFTSAHVIAQTPLATFTSSVVQFKIEPEAARRIHDHALTVEMRNEQGWANMMLSSSEKSLAAVSGPQVSKPKPSANEALQSIQTSVRASLPHEVSSAFVNGAVHADAMVNANDPISLDSMFGDMDQVSCDDCSSITGPSAYFVDLLRLLKNCPSNPADIKSPTVLDKLFERRPDLGDIELSCSNTNVIIPYIDLANEIMESFINYLGLGQQPSKGAIKVDAFNTRKDDTSDLQISEPQNVEFNVYQKYIQQQLSPMDVFPYYQAIDSMRKTLEALGSSRNELLSTFHSIERLSVVAQVDTNLSTNKALLSTLFRRTISAELFGMSHSDYVALAKESFWPFELVKAQKGNQAVTKEQYDAEIGLMNVSQYWGYAQGTTEMLDDTKGTGLSFIKSQLLPRSGLIFTELVDILQTQYIGQSMVITSVSNESTKFSTRLEDMRLHHASGSKLTEDDCDRLSMFIRLWRKTGWSIQDTDQAITIFLNLIPASTNNRNAGIIDSLAATSQLSSLSGIDVFRLLPLWGNISIVGPNSLYAKTFLQRRFIRQDPVFTADSNGNFLSKSAKFSEHMPIVLASLGLTPKTFDEITTSQGISDSLTLANVTTYYRISQFCKIFGISPSMYNDFTKIFTDTADPTASPLSSPSLTLTIYKRWQVFNDAGWTFPQLLSVVASNVLVNDDISLPSAVVLRATVTLSSGMNNINSLYQDYSATDSQYPADKATTEEVCRIVALLFSPADVPTVTEFIDGSFKVTTTFKFVATTAPVITIPDLIKSKLAYQKPSTETDAVLALVGTLMDQEKSALQGLSTDSGWTTAIQKIYDDSKRPYSALIAGYFLKNDAEAQKVFFDGTSTPATPPSDVLLAIQQESAAARRRAFFLQTVVPALRSNLQRQFILDTVKNDFNALDSTTLQTFLNEVMTFPNTSQGQVSGMTILQGLANVRSIPISKSAFNGVFIAQTTDAYQFIIPGPNDGAQPIFSISGITLSFTKDGPGWISSEIKLTNGQLYNFNFIGDINVVQWKSQNGTPSFLKMDDFLSKDIVDNHTGAVYSKLSKFARILDLYRLTNDEIKFFQRQGLGSKIINLNKLTISDLECLQLYAKIRDSLSHGSSSTGLMDLYRWMSTPSRSGTLASQIAVITGRTEGQIQAVMNATYPGASEQQQIVRLQDISALENLNKIMNVMSNSGLSFVSPETLFTWAEPDPLNNLTRNFEHAASLRLLAESSAVQQKWGTALIDANNSLRSSRRRALVTYLLQQPFAKDRGLIDADSLFEFFLIDVQMGSCLQTSRIKQAISAIQVFVQRCLLSLELGNGIQSTAIDLNRWNWMQKYRLWEANRKLFLYPENWIDPSLRDDKTEYFVAFETAIMQNDLNADTISEAVKSYIYSANEIADLDVLAYQWEKVDTFRGNIHLFARTKTSPYQTFYRKMEITGTTAADPYIFWYPWGKIDMDIPSFEVDANGMVLPKAGSYLIPAIWKKRLYLFMPQILLKTSPNPDNNTKKFSALADSTPEKGVQKYWELKIGWSEFRNGQWSPKKVSQAAINVKELQDTDFPDFKDATWRASAKAFPDISTFKFWIRARATSTNAATDGILIIDVERWVANGSSIGNLPLGRFEMRGPQLVIASLNDIDAVYRTPFQTTLPSVFGKLSMASATGGPPYTLSGKLTHGASVDTPLLAKIPSNVKRTVNWTVSYDDSHFNRPTGFVTEIDTGLAQGTSTFFSYPPFTTIISSDPDFISSIFTHSTSSMLMETATMSVDLDGIYDALAHKVPADLIADVFGQFNGPDYNELSTPYAIYNWELGVHAVSLLMERLLATQQFDLGIKIARYVFDPTAPGQGIQRCWLFPPFQDDKLRLGGSLDAVMDAFSPSDGSQSSMAPAVAEWRKHPFMPHSVARGRPVAYMKRIAMKYIEILIGAGDSYFRQNTLETIPFAIQYYIEASHVFGPASQQIPQLGKVAVKTYRQLASDLDDFSDAMVDLELLFPFFSSPQDRGTSTAINGSAGLMGFAKTRYFCVPTNPQLTALRSLIDDRLYKIRNCQDINGNAQRLPLFEPPIDPALLVRAAAYNFSPSVLLNDMDTLMPNYRFYYLLQKAIELCSELKNFGNAFLNAREKKDSEALSSLRARQDSAIQNLVMDMKKLQKVEALKAIDQLEESRRGPAMRLMFYQALIGEEQSVPGESKDFNEIAQQIEKPTTDDLRMTVNEKLEMDKADEASGWSTKASVLDTSASALMLLPNISENLEPLGVGTSLKMDAGNVAQFMLCLSGVFKSAAEQANNDGARASRKAQMIRQLQERRLQANLAGREVKAIDMQIVAAKARVDITQSDITLQEKQIADAAEVEDFLRSKYTNVQLYTWMDNSTRNLFYQSYTLAIELAKKVQRAYQFEQGTDDASFIRPDGYWDSGRDGLLSAENLYIGLKKLEAVYMEKQPYDFEVSKNLSLRQLQPLALLQLRETGVVEFAIPEVLYDLDYPGHYKRRVKSVSLSIPCLVGPYTSLNCTLSLLEHKYRTNATAKTASDYAENPDGDSRFRTDRVPITSIAVSTGLKDSGLFQLNFKDERYLPFEGAGAISRWRIELPSAFRQFDYSSISDVVMHVSYTAVNGGSALRKAATDSVTKYLGSIDDLSNDEGIFAVFDLKSDFSAQWYSFAKAPADPTSRSMKLGDLRHLLPFFTTGKTVLAKGVTIFVAANQKESDVSKATISLKGAGALTLGQPLGEFQRFETVGDVLFGDWELDMVDADGAKLVLTKGFIVFRYTLH